VHLGALLLLQCIAYTMETRPLKFRGIQGTMQGNRNNCRWPLGDMRSVLLSTIVVGRRRCICPWVYGERCAFVPILLGVVLYLVYCT